MPADLDALEALLGKATPGEWVVHPDFCYWILLPTDEPGYVNRNANAASVAALHNAAPAIIAELRELREDEILHVEVIGDLMDETTTLKAEIERLREANRWRPIAEAPRDNDGIEAIDSRTGFVRVVDYYKGYPPNWIPCWALQGASNECYPLDYFTHYRPIPYLPEATDAR